MRDQGKPGTRSLVEQLTCGGGLGYCCPYAFFRVNRRTGAIATRLGLAERTIRVWKAKFKAKEIVCSEASNCMLTEIRKGGK